MHSLIQLFVVAAVAALLWTGCSTHKAPPHQSAKTQQASPGEQVLFNGKTLKGWKAADFTNPGKVTASNGEIHLGNGYMTGVTYTKDVPRMNYEISLDARRVEGSDFFCGLTFPVDTNQCTFVVGGWGGGVVGLSSIDGEDASQNETTKYLNFVNGRWYHVRVLVLPKKIQAWIDDDMVADVDTEDKRLTIRMEVEVSAPLGVATWNTAADLRNIVLKRVQP